MGTVAKITTNGTTHLIASTAYGTCTTGASTVKKVATIQDSQAFTLYTGLTVHIKMSNNNTASSPTLNVNSTGDKGIMRYGTTYAGTSTNASWNAGSVVSFTYDGTYWQMNDFGLKGNDNTVSSAYCSTAAGTQAKTATQTSYVATANTYNLITIANANSYNGAITLNINSQGAKGVCINGSASSSSNKTLPAGTYLIYYDGTNYYFQTDGTIPRVNSIYWGNDASSSVSPLNADQLQGYTVNTLMKLFYPVGSVIMNTNNANPSTYITGTTWTLKSSVALASNAVFGNGKAMAVTEGTHYGAFTKGASNETSVGLGAGLGQDVGVSKTADSITNGKYMGVPTKSQLGANLDYSGLIADTITVYTWERTA